MSISGIYDTSIDIKTWINQSINNGKAPTDSISDHLQHLIGELRYQYDNKDYEFEKASEESLTCIPTILCEIERVSIESRKVHQLIDKFYKSLAQIEKHASHSINLLADIDNVKDRMENCLISLNSVDKLIQSQQKLQSLQSSDNVKLIAKEIEDTKANLQIIGDLKQFNNTREQIIQLENKLEGMACPLLNNSLKERNNEDTKHMIDLFLQMERKNELYEYINQFYIIKVTELWNNLTKTLQDTNETFSSCLSNFYTELANLLENDIRWIHKLLPNDSNISFSSIFLINSMEKLCSSYKSFLDQYIENNDSSFDNILELWHMSAQFYAQIIGVIGDSNKNTQIQLLEAIFSPYIPIQKEYSSIIKHQLLHKFNSDILIKPTEFSETISQLESRIPSIFHLCEEATNNFIEFTGGVDAEIFINTLGDIFVNFLNNWLDVLQELRIQSKVDIIETKSSLQSNLSYDISFSHDWTFVQGALQVLHASNVFSNKFNTFDGYLRNKFNIQGNLLVQDNVNSSSNIELYFFCNQAQKDIQQLSTFLSNLSDVAYKLLPTPHRMFVTFNTRIQSFVFDTMFQFIRERLNVVPTLTNWEDKSQVSSAGIELPLFSLSPLSYITQIGEHLFALPQQLEPFASGEDNDDIDTAFVSQWLQHISSNTMSLYLQKICQIRKLSNIGVNQLITDIDYLCEVLSPFGINADPSLQITLEFLRSPKEDYVAFLQSISDNTSIKIGKTIASMRSISIPNILQQSQ